MFKKNSRPTFQEQLRQKKRKKKGRKIFLWFFLLTISIAGIVYGLFFSPYFTIDKITVEGTDIISSQDVKQIVETVLTEKVWGVFATHNVFFFPVTETQDVIVKTFPPIKEIGIATKLHPIRIGSWNQKSEIVVRIIERPQTALTCDTSRCFFTDDNGVLFSPTASSSDMTLLHISESSIPEKALPYVLYSSDFISFIKNIKVAGSDEGIAFNSFSRVNDFGDIQAYAADGYSVFFTMSQDAKKQVHILKEILSKMIQGDSAKLDYVNLRVENRAYYKLKE